MDSVILRVILICMHPLEYCMYNFNVLKKMKKIFFSICLFVASVNAMAVTYTASATLSLTSASTSPKTLVLREAATFSDAFDNGYDVENANTTGIYVYANAKQWTQWATNNLEGAAIGVGTVADANYTITFSGVIGRELKFEDILLDSVFTIENSVTYNFTADADSNINDRFRIFKPFTPDAGELNICHQYGKLTINNNPYTTNIVVKNSTDVVVIDKAPRNTPQVIDLAALPAGRYTVEIGGQTLIIDVK